MDEARNGTVVTFYSYKGGTGRTMALANVAWILASAGRRVLVADWDLEAPGLPRFFRPFLSTVPAKVPGIIDLVRRFEDEVMPPRGEALHPRRRSDGWVQRLAEPHEYVIPVEWDFGEGSLDLLTAGRQNSSYATTLSQLDWDNFYELGGGQFFDALRENMRREYDYTLIDSRTGFSDVADICTQHLPDVLVDCFTLSDQGIDGAADVARAVGSYAGRRIRILPVAMRVDDAEKVKVDAGRARAMHCFSGLPEHLAEHERLAYFQKVEVPYKAFYAYEEILATFDVPGKPGSLLAAYERLTEVLTGGAVAAMPTMDEHVRTAWQRRFERPVTPERDDVVLHYVARDQVWAEWVESVLVLAGLNVEDPGPVETMPRFQAPQRGKAVLAIVSQDYLTVSVEVPGSWSDPESLAVLVGDVRPRDLSSSVKEVAVVGGLSADEARRRLLALVGIANVGSLTGEVRLARFPESEPQWFQAPARNAMFTGRTSELRTLRQSLRSGSRAVVLPVTLHGMGGIGKSQLALEYVHRFASAYDLVWWINADPRQFIDATLADLAAALHLPTGQTAAAAARSVLENLRRGTTTRRWLLVFDNAVDASSIESFLP
ncbi:MAG TPA: NB-ARC domain-containing protein, partial [Kineosporiaceae bacterium]